MKVLIVEEALKSLHGHWFQYISDIVKGGREAGHEIEVAVHKDACPEILQALPSRPILSATVFDKQVAPAGKLSGLKRVWSHNRSLYRDLNSFLSAGNTYDIIIATTTRLDHLLAYEALHWRFWRRSRVQWALIYIDAVGTYSPDYSRISFSKKLLPLKWGMRLSRLLPARERFRFFAESAGMARRFETFSGVKFSVVPHVTHLPLWKPDRKREEEKPGTPPSLVLATYGFTRYDKGLDILQDAIKILEQCQDQAGMRFVLQWTGDYRLPDGVWVRKDPALENSPQIQYIPAFSASNEYYEWVARTDIMVLPYRKDFYHDRLSRVAIDAAEAGIPIVYPAGTWLESFVEECAAGVGFQPENPDSLAQAIQKVRANYPALKVLAETRKTSVSEAFSARTFFNIITVLPPSPSLDAAN